MDGGANWARENTGFANVATEWLATNGTSLFAFTHGRGAWRVPLCAFSVSQLEVFVTASGGPASINIGAPSGCTWFASTAESWITIVSGDSGSGNGSLALELRENFTGAARQGIITLAGHTITVVQDGGLGEDCAVAIAPLFQSFSAGGGTGSINVFAEERCAWHAVRNSSWITVTSSAVGIGNGVVSYSVAPNSTSSGRSGAITIGGRTFSIKQKGGG